ncbi:hypothetical protein N7478_000982 [Penicillium angulare]|uniref:uncharacterized protein n=1 Tax=Penicillium angulare TaxID=116970 RepID=UPI0025418716|nr:uncharacterized protein N7478_000982 [Penicillium angulare]KAJ5291731.1 hypothetical protein N7478_000982 [Penicillium angulare]
MDAKLRTSVINDFQFIRGDFLFHLQRYGEGQIEDRTLSDIQIELRRLRNTLSMWSLIPGSQGTGSLTCFETRCKCLADATEQIADTFTDGHHNVTEFGLKMFEMLTLQLGRLTLEDSIGIDEEAGEWAIKAEMEQRKWESRNPADDTRNETMLRNLWARMHFKMICPCRQCLDFFIPGNGQVPLKAIIVTPRISPSPEVFLVDGWEEKYI